MRPDGDSAGELHHAHRDTVRSAAAADRLPVDRAGLALYAAAAIMIKDAAAATMRPKHAPTRPVRVPARWE